jgi:hypothetical protein
MFDSLDETMKHDELAATSAKERYLRYALITVLAVVLFAALFLGVRFLN